MAVGSAATRSGAWLVCRAAGHSCALPLGNVRETMRLLPIEALAGAPPVVLGLARVRGSIVPVIDLGRLFDADDGEPRALVTVALGNRIVALAVDRVLGVHRIADDALQALPPLLRGAAGDVVETIGTLDEELLLFLGTARLASHAALAALPAGLS